MILNNRRGARDETEAEAGAEAGKVAEEPSHTLNGDEEKESRGERLPKTLGTIVTSWRLRARIAYLAAAEPQRNDICRHEQQGGTGDNRGVATLSVTRGYRLYVCKPAIESWHKIYASTLPLTSLHICMYYVLVLCTTNTYVYADFPWRSFRL